MKFWCEIAPELMSSKAILAFGSPKAILAFGAQKLVSFRSLSFSAKKRVLTLRMWFQVIASGFKWFQVVSSGFNQFDTCVLVRLSADLAVWPCAQMERASREGASRESKGEGGESSVVRSSGAK